MIFYAYKLNGIFPVEALFKIIALFLLIKSGVMIARVVVWFVNVFRGSGAEKSNIILNLISKLKFADSYIKLKLKLKL